MNIIVKVFILKSYTLVGPIGSGKTTAQKIFQNLHVKCFCADSIVRELYEDEEIISRIDNIIPCSLKNGKIDKNLIRKLIFTDEKKMKLIEDFIQPKVISKFKNIKKKYSEEEIIIFVIPIIKKNKFIEKSNTIYISSTKTIRLERIKKRKNYNKILIENIINYQETIDIYKNNYSHIIDNNGSIQQLQIAVQQTLNNL